ncbi:MAG: class I SAM-dependent methyltransferase [Actinomycetota bacterium]
MSEWWEDFFESRWLDVQLGWAELLTDDEIDDLEAHLRLEPESDVLDVPSGEGRIGRSLAKRGHHVTGIDITDGFLEEGRRRAKDQGVVMRFMRGDMRELAFDGEFDAVMNVWGSFGYFDAEGDRAVAEGAFRALRPHGRFLIETITLETLLPEFREQLWHRMGEVVVLQENHFVHETSRIETEWTFIGSSGERDVRDSSIHIYSYAELTTLLREVGFTSFDAYDTTSGEPFALGADRLTLVATKPA